MRNYWTCSKFADWLRGTTKGGAKTSEGWCDWRKEAKSKHPFRFWLAEEGLDKIQDIFMFIPDKIYAVKYYINNRFITRTHALSAHPRDIRPGSWHDVGNRFLPCLFNELQDFVEVELAWWHIALNSTERAKYKPPFWATGWFRWRTWRCAQAGLDNLKWQSELVWQPVECEPGSPNIGKPTHQAERALEILALYKWWTQTYRNRPDPYEASGWSAYCEARRGEDGLDMILPSGPCSPELREQGRVASERLRTIEAEYEQEEELMMVRLIKCRNSLWT